MRPIRRIYLDTNAYCRPLDDQKDRRIHAEAVAILKIVNLAEKTEIVIISSDYVKFEIEQIKDPLKRKSIRGFERILSKTNITSSKRLITIAKEINAKCNINSLDALHLAASCIGKADSLITCDDQILDNTNCIEALLASKGYRLKVRNPMNYIRKTGE